ncbi:MAG: hypothetical protein ABEJ67_02115 [Halanaeroarchaeum sp.]
METGITHSDGSATDRRLTTFGVLLVVVSLLVAGWLWAVVGDVVTALWMVLFVVSGVVFVGIGRRPSPQ